MKRSPVIRNNKHLIVLMVFVIFSCCISCNYKKTSSTTKTDHFSNDTSINLLLNNSENYWTEQNENKEVKVNKSKIMKDKNISNIKPLGFTWETSNPFLFCVHHLDNYPAGNDDLGPSASVEGRDLKNSWRMYHGERVPGFPAHPHRFETVTFLL
jgi:hypothetical protein